MLPANNLDNRSAAGYPRDGRSIQAFGLIPSRRGRSAVGRSVRENLYLHLPPASPEQRSQVRLRLLNGFGLTCGGNSVPLAVSAQRLVAFLALSERPLPRVYVAGILWIDASDKRANGSLRSALWRVRLRNIELVEAAADYLSLNPLVVVDVRELAAQARRLLDPSCSCAESDFDESPFRGELLPGWYDDWVLIERERERQIRLHALEVLCERLTTIGRFGKAISAGLAAVNAEPLRESAHRAVIKAHLAEGNAAEALRQYRCYAQLLQAELQLEPSSYMKQLLRAISLQ